jgi:hypothetical protein
MPGTVHTLVSTSGSPTNTSEILEHFVETETCICNSSIQSEFWGGFLTAPAIIALDKAENLRWETNYRVNRLCWDIFRVRLVSRKWCAAVTRLLKLHQHWNVRLEMSSLQRAVACLSQTNNEATGSSAVGGISDAVRSLELEPTTRLQTFTRAHRYPV